MKREAGAGAAAICPAYGVVCADAARDSDASTGERGISAEGADTLEGFAAAGNCDAIAARTGTWADGRDALSTTGAGTGGAGV